MIDAGNQRPDGGIIVHAQPFQQPFGAHLHAVAQADGFDRCEPLHVPGQHRHGIGVIEEPGVGTFLHDVAGEILQHGNGAQCPEDAADAQRIADGLPQAEAPGHLKIRHRAGAVQADLDGVDHIFRTAKGLPAVLRAQIGRDDRFAAHVAPQRFQHPPAVLQPDGVDVVQGKFAVLQRIIEHTVADHILHKNAGTGAHEYDFRHRSNLLCPDQWMSSLYIPPKNRTISACCIFAF